MVKMNPQRMLLHIRLLAKRFTEQRQIELLFQRISLVRTIPKDIIDELPPARRIESNARTNIRRGSRDQFPLMHVEDPA
jgi:hypothetical protein